MGRSDRTPPALVIGLLAVICIGAACGADGEDPSETAPTLTEATPSSSDDPSSDPSSGSNATTASAEADDRGTTATTSATTSTTSESTSTTTEATSSSTTSSTTTTSSTSGRDGPELVDVRPVPIFSVRALGPTTLELTVEGGVEPCFIIDRVDVVEASDRVELTVDAGSEPDVICIQIIELHTTTVELDQPLDGRAVIDATTGQPLAVAS